MTLAMIYSIISIVAFAIAGIAFVAAVVMWINFRIPKIIGDLSGRTAKKSIEQRRSANEKSGAKSYRPTPVAVERGALTDTIEHSEKLKKEKKKTEKPAKSGKLEKPAKSGKLEKPAKSEKPVPPAEVAEPEKTKKNQTDSQQPAPATADPTTLLNTGAETTVLTDAQPIDGTTVLVQQETGEMKKKTKFVPLEDILLLASEEIV